MGKYRGTSRLALRPTDTQQVSQLLAYCSVRRLPVVPQGGNTGLVGGSVPVFDEVILSLSSMNKILSFDEVRMRRGPLLHAAGVSTRAAAHACVCTARGSVGTRARRHMLPHMHARARAGVWRAGVPGGMRAAGAG
jgi:hypothetical protein